MESVVSGAAGNQRSLPAAGQERQQAQTDDRELVAAGPSSDTARNLQPPVNDQASKQQEGLEQERIERERLE